MFLDLFWIKIEVYWSLTPLVFTFESKEVEKMSKEVKLDFFFILKEFILFKWNLFSTKRPNPIENCKRLLLRNKVRHNLGIIVHKYHISLRIFKKRLKTSTRRLIYKLFVTSYVCNWRRIRPPYLCPGLIISRPCLICG